MLLWQAGRAADARRIGERALVAGVSPAQEAEVRLGLALVTSEHSYLDAGDKPRPRWRCPTCRSVYAPDFLPPTPSPRS